VYGIERMMVTIQNAGMVVEYILMYGVLVYGGVIEGSLMLV
jgi:hypothetical protein